MASNVYNANLVTENGDSFIPASQRPDGTWRKARRVKEGYVPQEEVPLYESKGKQFANKKAEPVKLATGETASRPIPGLFIIEGEKEKKQNKKKNKTKVDDITLKLDNVKLSEKQEKKSEKSEKSSKKSEESSKTDEATDPAKKIKNLKKKLREIELLEEKIAQKQIAKPEPEQLAKIKRKNEILMQIYNLEKLL